MTRYPLRCQMPTTITMPVPVARRYDSGYIFGKRRDSLTTKFDLLFEDSLKEWMSFKPALGLTVYPCYACRHMFSTKSALQDHVNRRVLILQYNCTNCTEMQPCVFYNRCAILLHLRTHFDMDRGEINLENLTTDFLPIGLAGFLPHPDIPRLYEAHESPDNIDAYVNAQFYTPELTERGKQVVILKANDLTFHGASNQVLTLMQVAVEIPRCEFFTLEQQVKLKQAYLSARQQEEWQEQQRLQLQALVTRVNGAGVGPVEVKEEPPDEENSDYNQNMTLPIIAKVESLQETNAAIRLPKCLECNQEQEGTMAEHYLGDNRPFDMNLSCPTCKFIASTECSLKAHMRIHSGVSPHVCPDCGRDFDSPETLKEHMDDVCFHAAKLVRYRCPGKKCGKLFANNNTFGIHFKNHLSHTLTCSLCHAVLDSNGETESHKLRHPEEERQNCMFRRRHHCFLCPDEVITDKNYTEHINMHTLEMERCIYVYMCRLCRSNFRSTATYATHLLRCNGRGQSGTSASKKKTMYKDCEGCDTKIIYTSEKSMRFCNGCKMTKLLRAPSIETEPPPEKPQAPEKVQKPVHKRYYCILCENKINVEDKLKHMRRCEFAHPMVLIQRLTYKEIQKYTIPASSKEDFVLPPPKRRPKSESPNKDEHRRSRKRPSRPRPRHDLEPDLTADEPMKFDGTYYCKLCDFKNEDRAEFHQHIKTHRDVSTAYQCMECGECFVVKPSLMKHLMHFHNISDCEGYLEANDCYDVDAVKELQETVRLGPLASKESDEPLKENQCRVCREEFEDSVSLNKHFRIHGMAFLLKNSK
ncbi:unnamed protein product [Callosobruchus maculatus]|uniref:C2H2-type domain-containing protein n=2 Tax=Callosobruchus maculatus TaxID=64391 RepID=A0A653DNJ4_CALMS|nr:unnamed protein product [Callosobruchus maculatus]